MNLIKILTALIVTQTNKAEELRSCNGQNITRGTYPKNFGIAKRAAKKIFADSPQTFYCNCSYSKNNSIDLSSCDFKSHRFSLRTKRVEWEHIVSAWTLGKDLPCWNTSACEDANGRECCHDIDAEYNLRAGDLHNLVPAIGEANAVRSNKEFTKLPEHQESHFGGCFFKVDEKLDTVEPDDRVKGAVARAHLYMTDIYSIGLAPEKREMFFSWHTQHPPQTWELEWNEKVKAIQGNDNCYIKAH